MMMRSSRKPINEQAVVITGASSGIGRATARLAADAGARLALNSRDEHDLLELTKALRIRGATVAMSVGDVADEAAMIALAETAVRDLGGIDTWVNNAGVSIYGRIEEVTVADARRLFETNYWGVVNGSLAALPHLRRSGGTLINVGSILSDTGYPLQGHYTASKHAVKGFTDSLRLELEHDGAPVAVTLIQPAAIDTPYPEHARSYLGVQPKHLPPVYAPEIVAEAILECAERPKRDVLVGGGAKVFQTMEKYAPRLGDRVKEAMFFDGQQSDNPADEDSLYRPQSGDARERGRYPGRVMRTSLYTRARLHPEQLLVGLAVAGAGYVIARQARSGRR
jgi:NAD(P)-dependent dehydrogenase (short-subunit alcohol dehydrogenase family)